MAAPKGLTLDAQGMRRVLNATLDTERRQRETDRSGSVPPASNVQKTFIIASDPSDYDSAVDTLPVGYRGHVIAYRLLQDYDLADLPEVPDLDTLLQAETKPLDQWEQHQWVKDHEDETLGRPVLLNVCKHAQGLFFRGQIVEASYLPGWRYSDAYRGSHFGWAAPTYGEWPTGIAAPTTYDGRPGWCVTSGGHQLLTVTLETELDPDGSPEYAEAHALGVSLGGESLQLAVPGAATTPTLFVYSQLDLDDPIPDGSDAQVGWAHHLFRLQLLAARCV
jgi:hypothetical protein